MLDEDAIEETQNYIVYLLGHYTLRGLARQLGYKNGHPYLSQVIHGVKKPSASLYQKVKSNADILIAAENARQEQIKAMVDPEYRPPQPEYDDSESQEAPYDYMNEVITKSSQDIQQLRERREMHTPQQYNTVKTFHPDPPAPEPQPERCQGCGRKMNSLAKYKLLDARLVWMCRQCVEKYRQHHGL